MHIFVFQKVWIGGEKRKIIVGKVIGFVGVFVILFVF